MDCLWPELGPDSAAPNLRKAVHFARRALGGKDSIAVEGQFIELWPGGRLHVDVDQPDTSGELLPEEPYTDWIQPHRERLRLRRIERLRAEGRWEQLFELDPTDEVACRALIRAHLDHGERQAAIKRFLRLREILRVDLCVAPEPETVALFEEAVATRGPSSSAPSERAQTLLARGLVQWTEREFDAAESSAKEARAVALESGLDRELGEASSLLGMVAMLRGRWPEVFRQEFASAIELHPEQAPLVLDAHLCLAEASVNGDPIATGMLARELLQPALAAGSMTAEALMSLLIGESEYFAGRLDESHEWLTRAAELYEGLNNSSGLAFVLIRRAELASIQRQPSIATTHLSVARRRTDESALVSHLRPRVLEAKIKCLERREHNRAIVGEAQDLIAHSKETCRTCSIGLGVAAAIATARAGEVAEARYWLDFAERRASMWTGTPWQAAVWEARGELRLAEGDRGQALALMREAGELYRMFGRRLDEVRCMSAGGLAS
jgi:DNA-binding SARP family transcriptional activator